MYNFMTLTKVTEKIYYLINDRENDRPVLGEYLNVTDKAVSKWECGKCLEGYVRVKLCRMYRGIKV